MGIGLVLVACGIYGLMRPAEYKARATIKLERLDTHSVENSEPYDPNFVQTEIETIRSDTILSNVLFQLDHDPGLDKRLINSEAITRLRGRLDLRTRRGTTVLDVCAVSEIAKEAAEIANTVAKVYKNWRYEENRRLVGWYEELVKQFRLADQAQKKAEAELAQLKEELKIPSPEPFAAELQTNYPAYQKAKRELDDLNAIRNLLVRKISIENIGLSHLSPEVIEMAIPPTMPMQRTKPLGALLAVVGVICFGWGVKQVWFSHHSENER